MRKKCLLLTILLLGFQLGFIESSWPTEPNDNNKLLISALKDLQWTIIEKIEHEADTTATAFADAERIDRDLRLKDIFRTPLVIIEETINTISSLVNAGKIAENAQQVLDSSEANLQITSTIMSISTLKQVGENLQLAIDGPSYCSTIEEMLDKAYRRSSTRIEFNPDAYKTVIKDYLYAQYEPGPLRIPHKSTDLSRRNLEIVSGIYKIERSITERFRALRDKLENNPLSPDSASEAINQIEKIKRAIIASKSSYQELSYQTYLKDETGSYIPNTVDSRLGSIAELEKMRRIALANSDKEMMIEQITIISRAVRAGIQATTLHIHTKYKSPKTGKVLGEVQKWSIVPSMIEVGISKYFDTNAREQVNMIPQEMMMDLPLELSNVWMVADDTASYIEYLIEIEKEEPLPERRIAAEIKLKDGFVIEGAPIHQERIKIKTKYGEMDIPVENFISIIGELIKLKDGTTLQGNFAEKTLNVKTDYGELKVQTKDIDSIIFTKEPEPPAKKPVPSSAERVPIPEFHGIYLVSQGQFVDLKETRINAAGTLMESVWGIKSLSGVTISDKKAYIILYSDIPPQSVDLAKLKYLHKIEYEHPVMEFLGEPVVDVEMWVADEDIRLKVAPIEGKGDMYRLVPAAPLSPGVYAIHSGNLYGRSPVRVVYEVLDFRLEEEVKVEAEIPVEEALLFSSPEKTVETMLNAMLNSNLDLALQCMAKKLRFQSQEATQRQIERDIRVLQGWMITGRALIDRYALIMVKSPRITLLNLLKKVNGRWEIAIWDEMPERLPETYEELYQEPLPSEVIEWVQRVVQILK